MNVDEAVSWLQGPMRTDGYYVSPETVRAIRAVLADREYWKDLAHDYAVPGLDAPVWPGDLREQERDMRLAADLPMDSVLEQRAWELFKRRPLMLEREDIEQEVCNCFFAASEFAKTSLVVDAICDDYAAEQPKEPAHD